MRVILADDHNIFREGLRALLESRDKSIQVVGEAADGLEVLALAAETNPDVVILDIYMPGLDGLEVTRRLRERFPGTKVIILSSYPDKMYVKEALKHGAMGFITKDAVFEELIIALKALKNNKLYLSPGLPEPFVDHYLQSPPASKETQAFQKLTKREREIFYLFALGCSRRGVAAKLYISPKTVDTHRMNIQEKLKLKNEAEFGDFAKLLQLEA